MDPFLPTRDLKLVLLLIALCLPAFVHAQQQTLIDGNVKDAATGKPLVGVNVPLTGK